MKSSCGKSNVDSLMTALTKVNREFKSHPYARPVSRRSVLLRNARKANESDDFSSILNAISQKGKETQKDPNDYSHLADIISDVTSQPGDRHPQLLETFQMLFSPKRKTFPKLANVQNFSLTSEPQLPLFPKDLANIFAPELPSTFECLVCRGIFPIVEGRILCSSILKSVEAGDSHPVCVNCIREYAHNSVFDGQVGSGGVGLKCVHLDCENVLLLSEFEKYIKDEDYELLKIRLQEQCLLDAALKDLVTCSECGYKVCIEQTDSYFHCVCGRIQCRNCPRIFDDEHRGRTCEKVKRLDDERLKLQTVAPQLSEILIRTCHRCGIQYVKEYGCNKMTCRCGAKQCYVCRKDITDESYHHYCTCAGLTGSGGAVNGKPCSKCGKSCVNSDRLQERDQRRVRELRERNGINL